MPDPPVRRTGKPDGSRSRAVVARSRRGRLPPSIEPRLLARRARQRLAPTGGTASGPGVRIASCDGCIPPPRRSTRAGALRDPRPVGVRRCLTRRPGGPAEATVAGRPWWCRCDGNRGIGHRCCRAGRRGGRGSASPLRMGCSSSLPVIPATGSRQCPRLVGVRRCLTPRSCGPAIHTTPPLGSRCGSGRGTSATAVVPAVVHRPPVRSTREGEGACPHPVGVGRAAPDPPVRQG